MDAYPWLKLAHILLAVVAVGSNVTYGIWQARATREPQHVGWALRGVKFLDDRVANPAYLLLGAVGVAMVLIGPYEFETLWIAISIGLYVALALVGFGLYSPRCRARSACTRPMGPMRPSSPPSAVAAA